MIEELRLSNSEMATWRDCRRKWYLGVYHGYKPKKFDFGRPTGLGTRVHDVLSLHYDPRIETFDAIGYIKEMGRKDIEDHPSYEDDITKDVMLATIMVEGYLQWLEEEGVDSDLRMVAPEAIMETPMAVWQNRGHKVPINLLSKIDARVEREYDGVRFSLEHKTVQSLTTPLPLLQIDSQLLTEHLTEYLALRSEVGDEEASERRAGGVLYNMMKKVKRTASAKPPFYGREEVRHNMNELRNHWTHVMSIADDILNAHADLEEGKSHQEVCYPSPGKDCTWKCDFFNVCGMFDDGISDTEMAMNDLYVKKNHLERYDEATPFEKYLTTEAGASTITQEESDRRSEMSNEEVAHVTN